jgi:hypothetical protein
MLRAGFRHGDEGAALLGGIDQPRHQILRQKRSIAGKAREPFGLEPICVHTIEARQHTGQRSLKAPDLILDD